MRVFLVSSLAIAVPFAIGERAAKSAPRSRLDSARAAKKTDKTKKPKSSVAKSRAQAASSNTSSVSATTGNYTDPGYLADDLMSICLSSRCEGEVPWAECLSRETVSSLINSDSTCRALMDKAADDNVRMQAKVRAWTQISRRLESQCENLANGEWEDGECKVKITYEAAAPREAKDASPIRRSKEFSVGKSVTCSYSAFGLSMMDMEVQTKATAEQEAAKAEAIMGLVKGGMNTGLSVVNTVIAAKELKKANQGDGDRIYYFDKSNSLKLAAVCSAKSYDKKAVEDCGDDGVNQTLGSDTGGKFCATNQNPKGEFGPICKNNSTSEKIEDKFHCDNPEYNKGFEDDRPYAKGDQCWVRIQNDSDLARRNKEADLIRKFGMNTGGVQEAYDNIAIMNQITQMGIAQAGAGAVGGGGRDDKNICPGTILVGDHETVRSSITTEATRTAAIERLSSSIDRTRLIIKDITDAKDYLENIQELTIAKCERVHNGYLCLKEGERETEEITSYTGKDGNKQSVTAEDCHLNASKTAFVYTRKDEQPNPHGSTPAVVCNFKPGIEGTEKDVEAALQGTVKPDDLTKALQGPTGADINALPPAVERYVTCKPGGDAGDMLSRSMNAADQIKALQRWKKIATEDDRKKIYEFEQAQAQYQANQRKLKEENDKIAGLKAQKDDGIQTIISGATSLALEGGMGLMTINKAISANRGSRTGRCYIGANMAPFMADGETKKIGWRN